MGISKNLKENPFFQELLNLASAYNKSKNKIELLNIKGTMPLETVIKNRLPVNKVDIKKDKIILHLS